jgi:hypothetical protein
MSQANAISDLERAEHSSIVQAKRVSLVDNEGSQLNPATEAKQDELLSLTETLQELSARLSILASMANAGQPALRIIPISLPTLANVTTVGTVTTVATLTNFGTGVPAREVARATNNATAILSNINNVTT